MSHAIVLTMTEAAEMSFVSTNTVRKWADQGLIGYHRLPGGHRRIHGTSLALFLKQYGVPLCERLRLLLDAHDLKEHS